MLSHIRGRAILPSQRLHHCSFSAFISFSSFLLTFSWTCVFLSASIVVVSERSKVRLLSEISMITNLPLLLPQLSALHAISLGDTRFCCDKPWMYLFGSLTALMGRVFFFFFLINCSKFFPAILYCFRHKRISNPFF